MDEPLGALDLKLREHMKVELKALQAAFNTTFVYITHDQSEAFVMSDNIAVINNGKFEQIGSPHDVYHAPETAFVAGFVGDANKIKAKVSAVNGTLPTLLSDGGSEMKIEAPANTLRIGDRAQVFLRPEAIELCTTQEGVNVSQAEVTSVLFNGANSSITVKDHSGDLLKIALPQTGSFANLRIGDSVLTRWPPKRPAAIAQRRLEPWLLTSLALGFICCLPRSCCGS